MKALIVYDSMYGNTKKIAEAMGKAVTGDARVVRASDASPSDIASIDMLIVGSPVQGGRPTPAIQEFLTTIPSGGLNNVAVAAFDTRFLEKDQGFALRLLLKTIGYAAPRIADSLKSKGGKLVAPPEGFIVVGKEGPLKQEELERAAKWAKEITQSIR